MTSYQAFMMGVVSVLVPSFAVLVLLFFRSRILLGRTFTLTRQSPEQALRIIRGGRSVDASSSHVSAYHHLTLVDNVSVVPQTMHRKRQPQNS